MTQDIPAFLTRIEPSAPTPWMPIAEGEIGTREVPGPDSNPDVVSYFAEAGHSEIADDETAWCAAFVGAMLARADYPTTGSLAARSYLNYGRQITRPEPGCIVVLWRGSPTSWQGHVGFYAGDAGTHVRVLGGNQRNEVNVTAYPKHEVLGYRMPVTPTARELADAGSTEIPMAQAVKTGSLAVGAGNVLVEAAGRRTVP